MKRILSVVMISMLSGCSIIGIGETEDVGTDVEQATTVVDAVEGDRSEVEDTGIIDTLRGRTDPIAGDPAWAPIHPSAKPAHYAAATGSLFNANFASDLYDDSKPHGIGDIVTVLLDESTAASKSADADLSKSNAASMDPLSVGGQELAIGDYNFSYELNNDNAFNGASSANQSNSISGSITVEVIEVLANGNLVIRGEKWLTLNTGDEYIRLSGTIRPDDISFENTIASTRISNARIKYSGTGTQQDMQEPGFLARFFNVSL
ncbi:flagellar basal body L-ring protein FlgH [Vibrio hannami]|uniref:flagellar basal body L-ring protein FlgH n=1 Tax=Vibrio hannami TaxID=2717094 RepID=UPI0024103F8F|nr:flagellar basal body L-ring protein FlgH [Vibrio hannami]MDG3088794.1 flagellar basal body L-ring protein FlgH [Vibrio hannami]